MTLVERLRGVAGMDLRIGGFLAHTMDTAKEAADEIERLRAVVDAARRMPRWTPKGGSASTMHMYQIKAADTWALDAALKALGGDEQKERS